MKNVFRKLSVIILVLFAMGVTGCISDNKSTDSKIQNKVITKSNGGNTTTPQVIHPSTNPSDKPSNLPAYVPSDKARPELISFKATNIDQPIVQKGQTVKFLGEAMTGKYPITIQYSATGGTVAADGTWTAPDKAGYYEISAVAVDTANNIKSEPLTMTVRVAKAAGDGGILLSKAPMVSIVNAKANGPKRAISVSQTNSGATNYILNTSASSSNTTATITLTFDDTSANHIITPSFTDGTLTFVNETVAGVTYTATYKYTAPAAVPASGRANIAFNIFNPSVTSDSDSATVSFIINTEPTVTSVLFTTGTNNTIGLGATKPIKVTASDVDTSTFSDRLTFTYTILSTSNKGTITIGDGASNTTGEIDYIAPNVATTVQLLVLVQDTRGASVQKTFTIYVQNPMSMAIADAGIVGGGLNTEADKYAEVTGDNSAKYKLGTKNLGSQVSLPIGNNYDINTVMGADAYYYFKDTAVARGAQTVLWEVYNEYSSSSAIKGPGNIYLNTAGNLAGMQASAFRFAPNGTGANLLMGRGGVKTIKSTVTAGVETISSTDTVRVNELPYVTTVTFKDATGTTTTLFNGTTNKSVQVPRGQSFYVNIGVADADNDRISPTTTDFPVAATKGFFANRANASAESAQGVRIEATDLTTIDYSGTPSWLPADNSTGITLNAPTYSNDYKMSFSDIKIDVNALTAAFDTTNTYHYLYLHVTDGYGVALNATGGQAIDYYRVGYEMNVADTNARGLDIGTVAGMTSFTKNLVLEFIDVSGSIKAKIKDLDTNTYLTKKDGTDVTIDVATAVGNATLAAGGVVKGTDYAQLDTVANEDLDWLAISFVGADRANWKAGDKVYFKTYANTVLIKYQVVDGARITTYDAPLYVTLGQTAQIKLAGNAGGTSTSATITLSEPSNSSGGVLEKVADAVGATITGKVWNYTAPNTMPASKTVNLVASIRDPSGNVNTTPITFELNRKPSVNGVSATNGVDYTDGEYWTLSGVNNIQLLADATDPDGSSDILRYDWGLNASYGSLTNTTQPITFWSPINTGGFLNGVSGPHADGMIPFSVAARDFDKNGNPKGGYSGLKAFSIGINDAPTVGTLDVTAAAPFATAAASASTLDFTQSVYPDQKAVYSLSTLNDALADQNNLTFQWYITDSNTGKQAQNVGTVFTTPTLTNNLPAQKVSWIPSAEIRKIGGTYVLHARVSDPKHGVAKGITEAINTITVTLDNAAPGLLATEVTITPLINNGTNGQNKIGDKLRFKLPIATATNCKDVVAATIDVGMFTTAGGAGNDVRPMVYNDNGTPANYADDYLYYDLEIKAVGGAGLDVAAGANNATVVATDMAGNTMGAGVASANNVKGIDATIDLQNLVFASANNLSPDSWGGLVVGARANPNTAKPHAANVLCIGDEIILPAGNGMVFNLDDTTTAYTAASCKLDGSKIGLGAAITADGVANGSPGEFQYSDAGNLLVLPAYKEAVYTAAQWFTGGAAQNILPVTVTDDAGNKATAYLRGDNTWSIDLRRPAVSKVTMYSYDNGADGLLGTADDALIEKDGTRTTLNVANALVQAATAGKLDTNRIAPDADPTTMEIMAITFDKAMDSATLNDISIKVNQVNVTKTDLSTGTGTGTVANAAANSNMIYVAGTKTLYISLINTAANAPVSVARNAILEVLFTDNSAATTGLNDVVCDSSGNEIDYTKDFTDGQAQGYLQW